MLDFPNPPLTTGQTWGAPNGSTYTWDGVKWTVKSGGAGGAASITISDTAPSAPQVGAMWWDSVGCELYIFYQDPTGAPQWVAATNYNSQIGEAPTDGVIYGRQSSGWTAVQPAAGSIGRNKIHNALFNIAQRGTALFSVTTPGFLYTLDRWKINVGLAGETMQAQQNAAADSDRTGVGDEELRYYCTFHGIGSATAGGACYALQNIEKVQRLSGKTVILSFYVAGSASLVIGAQITQGFGTGGTPSASVSTATQTVTCSTSWARYTLTFSLASAAGKTFGTNGDDSTAVTFFFSQGAGGTVPTQSGYFNVWGVQLEVVPAGSGQTQATNLEKLDPRLDLSNCQRFYSVGQIYMNGYGTAGMGLATSSIFPVVMRATPTLTVSSQSSSNMTTPGVAALGPSGLYTTGTVTAAGVATINMAWTASADL